MNVKSLIFIFTLTGFIVTTGCSYLVAGSLEYQSSKEVEAALKNGEIANGFNFYFSGSSSAPHTIIGVTKSIPFDQSLWQGTESTPETVQKWYEIIDNPHRDVRDIYFGGYIVTASGEKIGVWYSKHRFVRATLRDDGTLHIARPHRKNKVPGKSRRAKSISR